MSVKMKKKTELNVKYEKAEGLKKRVGCRWRFVMCSMPIYGFSLFGHISATVTQDCLSNDQVPKCRVSIKYFK